MAAAHPTPHLRPNYLAVFAWLTVLTAVEVGFSYLPLPSGLMVTLLVSIAVAKAALVVLYFMHLRYDSRWYALILIVALFFALLFGWGLLVV